MALPTVDHMHSRAFGHKSTECTGWRPSLGISRDKVRFGSAADRRQPEEWCRDGDGRPCYLKRSRRPSKMATDGCGAKVFFLSRAAESEKGNSGCPARTVNSLLFGPLAVDLNSTVFSRSPTRGLVITYYIAFGLSASMRHHDFLAPRRPGECSRVQTRFTWRRRVRNVTALCAELTIGGVCVGALSLVQGGLVRVHSLGARHNSGQDVFLQFTFSRPGAT